MSNYRNIQFQFNSGLLSPIQEGAVGTSAYAAGLSIAENVFFGASAGVFKRNGTMFGAAALADSVAYAFVYDGEVYAVEFGDKTARLLDGDGKVVGSSVTTPYAKAEIDRLCCTSFLDRLYITHSSHRPASMTIEDGQLTAPVEIEFVESQTSPATEGTDRTVCKTFDSQGDYPALNAFYGGRWYLHSTKNEPLTIWASRSFDSISGKYRINDFTLQIFQWQLDGSTDDEGQATGEEVEVQLADLAFSYLSSNMYGTSSRWMLVHQCLLLGTARALFKDGGNSAVTATTESPFTLSLAMEYGTRGNRAVAIGSYVFYPGTDGRTLMCAAYSDQYSSYTGTDISGPVSRYLKSGIRRIAAISMPIPLVWVLANDGTLLCCLFQAGTTIAWSVMTFDQDDHPEWIEDLQGGNDGDSKLLLIMKRGSQRMIETLPIVPVDTLWEQPYLDCCTVDEDSPITGRSITTVDITFDGSVHRYSSSVDNIQIQSEDATRYRGIPYTSVIGNMRAELPANGTSQSTMRSIRSVVLRLHKSLGGSVAPRPDLENTEQLFVKDQDLTDDIILYSRYGERKYGQKDRLFSGEKQIPYSKSNVYDDRLVIRSKDPFPFCITALIVNYSTSEV